MTDEINPSELGAYTNNLPNKEGLKKLVNAVNNIPAQLTAGDNISISDGVISATDTKYTAGDNIAISDQNVISATDTKYTAGTGITISEQNVISASGGGSWTLRPDNNDWSDLVGKENNHVVIKKDIYIFWKLGYTNFGFLPKGFEANNSTIYLNTPSYQPSTTTQFTIYSFSIDYNRDIHLASITIDLTNGTVTKTSIQTQKSDYIIYTKD